MCLLFRGCLSLLLAASVAVGGAARGQQYQVGGAAAPPGYPGQDMGQQLAALSDQPSTHTGFTFDRSMLQIAQNLLESGGMDAHRAAVAVTGVSFDSYHYQQPAFYTPEVMTGLIASYKAAGWKHLVNGNQTAGNTAQPKAAVMDLWLHFSGGDIDAVTVLTRASHDMNVVRLTGDLKLMDLLHLAGHFGIPKVDPSAVMVPER